MKKKTSILWGQKGISFIELLIVMTLVVIVLTMNTDTFGVIFRQSRQQTQAVGAQMDRVVGLEILRTDLEHAGFGLPWSFQNAIIYSEATGNDQKTYNDGNDATSVPPNSPPRALVSGNDPTFTLNNSDYLVIKSTIVGTSETSQRWTYITGDTAPEPHSWGPNNVLENGDRVTVIWPRSVTGFNKELVMDGTSFSTIYSSSAFPVEFSPAAATTRFVIYGVGPSTTTLRRPFNRADYYIQRPTSMPQACAPNTGILYKATINHDANGTLNPEPLIDCVADMQVIYRLDTNNDGAIDSTVNDISGLTAQQIRDRVKEIRVYILSHEGQKDGAFKFASSAITVGETFGGILFGRTFNLSATIAEWEKYRWKVSTLVVKPRNLAS
jgi:type II secretory pathway pseudopilin PulG